MAAVTICSDFGAQKNKVWQFPHLFPMKWWDWMPWSSFSESWALSQLFHSPLSLSSRGFWVPLHFLPIGRVVSSAYLRLLIFLLPILIPACASSTLAFLMMYSAYKLNRYPSQLFHLTSGHLVTAIPVIFSISPWFYVSLCLSTCVCMHMCVYERKHESEGKGRRTH